MNEPPGVRVDPRHRASLSSDGHDDIVVMGADMLARVVTRRRASTQPAKVQQPPGVSGVNVPLRLPKYHQVGKSGKSVKPKIYLALGISGAFQHLAGIAGAGTVIAVNKDKKAPIFRAADYGAVADALDIVAALKTELHKNWPR